MTKQETITLETERLLLKAITPEYYHYLHKHCSDEEIKELFGFNDAELAKAKARISMGMTNYHTTFRYFLFQDKVTGKTIGTGGFFRWYQEHDRAEVGYSMTDEAYRNKGLTKEAISRIIQYGFEDMNLYRIEALASPQNTPSIKILESMGLQYEGLLRGHYLKGDVYEDSASYGILKDEYMLLNKGK